MRTGSEGPLESLSGCFEGRFERSPCQVQLFLRVLGAGWSWAVGGETEGQIVGFPPVPGGPLANLAFPLAVKQEMADRNTPYKS